MAILPGSLDYLYYNGIIDHIPYEAYEMTPMTPSGMAQMSGMSGLGFASQCPYHANATEYLNAARKGLMYDTYTHPDVFVQRNGNLKRNYNIKNKAFCDGEGYGRCYDSEAVIYGQDGKNFRQSIREAFSSAKESVSSSPSWMKGILAGGIILTTLCCLFGRRTPKIKS